MAQGFDIFNRIRRTLGATQTGGVPGVAMFSGYVIEQERHKDLSSREERYRTYSDILANVSIVSAGVRYFLNLIGNADWNFTKSDADKDGMYAERLEQMLREDPVTPWHRIVRRAAMYRFYGFGIQEWTAGRITTQGIVRQISSTGGPGVNAVRRTIIRPVSAERLRRDNGVFTFVDIAPRAQLTIERWDVLDDGMVVGMVQRNPQNQAELYLPRSKVLYIVDDSLNDSPEGLGLFRHLIAPARRLQKYEQLEGQGYEMDLRGIPIGRAPFTQLQQMVTAKQITEEERAAVEQQLRTFITKHIRNPKLGLLLDSMVYESQDDAARPSNQKQWDIELLQGSSSSFRENAEAIERLNREMARILGVEQLLLGANSRGSFALSRDKTHAFYLLIDGSMKDIKEAVDDDIINRIWQLNGWPEEMKPETSIKSVRFNDGETIARALRDLAAAGLSPDNPVIGQVYDMLGLDRPDSVELGRQAALDAALGGGGGDTPPGGGGNSGGENDDGNTLPQAA